LQNLILTSDYRTVKFQLGQYLSFLKISIIFSRAQDCVYLKIAVFVFLRKTAVYFTGWSVGGALNSFMLLKQYIKYIWSFVNYTFKQHYESYNKVTNYFARVLEKDFTYLKGMFYIHRIYNV